MSRDRVHPTWGSPDAPCSPEPHEAHYDEHGSCPGVPEPEASGD